MVVVTTPVRVSGGGIIGGDQGRSLRCAIAAATWEESGQYSDLKTGAGFEILGMTKGKNTYFYSKKKLFG